MWIERGRGSTRRVVVVFVSGLPARECGDMGVANNYRQEVVDLDRHNDGEVEDEKPRRHKAAIIDGRIIYDVDSYDLREDLTHCTFSEVTGRIVLGNRWGEVIIL